MSAGRLDARLFFFQETIPMSDLVPPHGGVSEPINRTVADLGGPFAKNILLSDADLSSLYRIGDGGLSPLTGPMTGDESNRVLDEEVIVRDGKKYAWTIPIAFPITDDEAASAQVGDDRRPQRIAADKQSER